jgi:high-affinity Fe2+/Pb2+ permease
MNSLRSHSILFAVLAFSLITSAVHAAPTYNHDMSAYEKIAGDALKLANANDIAGAHKALEKLEDKWDSGTKDLKTADAALWAQIDDQMDAGIKATEGKDSKKAAAEIKALLEKLGKISKAK